MTNPRQPEDPPPEPPPSGTGEHAPNGIPPGADDATPKGHPSSDRHDTETAAKDG